MVVDAGGGFPGNAGTDIVDNAQSKSAQFLGLPDGGQGIGRFSGLADGNDYGAFFQNRFAVPKLGSVFHFRRHAHLAFNQVLPDPASVMGRAAGHEDYPPGFL